MINTNGRRDSLANTLRSLAFLNYPSFEVCVVVGPTEDGTRELLAGYAGRIKAADCPEHNLSMSRNIGIAMAAGDYVAFVDDDALPEPEWLRDLAAGYDDPLVAATGGVVYDHTGWRTQYLYTTANRLGNADWRRDTPAAEYNFPLSNNFPYLQGTNTSFRRDYLVEVGGFDEEIEFYLDETDVCCRLVDAGYHIRQLPCALVHHKFLPSHIRNVHKVTRNRYPVLKNKIYFSIVNNHGHYTMTEVIVDAQRFIKSHAEDAEMHAEAGRLSPEDVDKVWQDADRAWERGLRMGLSRARRLLSASRAKLLQEPFLEFERTIPAGGRKVFCFFSQEYPPHRIGGIGTYTRSVATALAASGHHVHVLTRSDRDNTVDFEDDVWVHRLEVKHFAQPDASHGLVVPQHIWNYSATVLEEAQRIHRKRAITTLEAPIWDGEGIAALLEGQFPVVLSLHTSLGLWLRTHQDRANDFTYMRDFGTPMLGVERYLLENSPAIHANSEAIISALDATYGLAIDRRRTQVIHHGIADVTELPAVVAQAINGLHLLFVGRLEERKGVDVLLHAFGELLQDFPNLHLDVVGDDAVPWHGIATLRDVYSGWPIAAAIGDRVTFHGRVSEADLHTHFTRTNILVVPSRFESFGLTAIEGFVYGRPVVSTRAGGLAEVVVDGETGLLVEPGDIQGLRRALERLITDADLRQQLGEAGRREYEARFTNRRMAEELEAFLSRLERVVVPADQLRVASGPVRSAHLWADQAGLLLGPKAMLELPPGAGQLFLTFWRHEWSGRVQISCGASIWNEDLYAARPGLFTIKVVVPESGTTIRISPVGSCSERSQGCEVIFYRATRQSAQPEPVTSWLAEPPVRAKVAAKRVSVGRRATRL